MGVRALEGQLASGHGPLDTQQASAALAGLLADHMRVRTGYLFGSQARGQARSTSDVDIAVWLLGSPSPADLNEAESLLSSAASAALGRDDVDVVVLNGADVGLRYRAVCEGLLVFERVRGSASRDRCRAFKEWVEARALRDRQAHRVLASARERAR